MGLQETLKYIFPPLSLTTQLDIHELLLNLTEYKYAILWDFLHCSQYEYI